MAPDSIPQGERMDLNEVIALLRVRTRDRPTFLEWAGLQLVFVVLGLITALVGGLLLYWMLATPPIAAFGNPVTKESLELYQKASDLVFQRVTSVLDLVLFKSLLPVLTAVLGYTFARALHRPPPEGEG